MIYQLPNGRCLFLSIEEYLSISDEELHYLAFTQVGEYPTTPTPYSGITPDAESSMEDTELDYKPEETDYHRKGPIYIKDVPDETIQWFGGSGSSSSFTNSSFPWG